MVSYVHSWHLADRTAAAAAGLCALGKALCISSRAPPMPRRRTPFPDPYLRPPPRVSLGNETWNIPGIWRAAQRQQPRGCAPWGKPYAFSVGRPLCPGAEHPFRTPICAPHQGFPLEMRPGGFPGFGGPHNGSSRGVMRPGKSPMHFQ